MFNLRLCFPGILVTLKLFCVRVFLKTLHTNTTTHWNTFQCVFPPKSKYSLNMQLSSERQVIVTWFTNKYKLIGHENSLFLNINYDYGFEDNDWWCVQHRTSINHWSHLSHLSITNLWFITFQRDYSSFDLNENCGRQTGCMQVFFLIDMSEWLLFKTTMTTPCSRLQHRLPRNKLAKQPAHPVQYLSIRIEAYRTNASLLLGVRLFSREPIWYILINI